MLWFIYRIILIVIRIQMHRLINRGRGTTKSPEKSTSKKKKKGTKLHDVDPPITQSASSSEVVNNIGGNEKDDVAFTVETPKKKTDDVTKQNEKETRDVKTKGECDKKGTDDVTKKEKINKKEKKEVKLKEKKKLKSSKKENKDAKDRVKPAKKGKNDVTKKVKKDKKDGETVGRQLVQSVLYEHTKLKDRPSAEVTSQNDGDSMTSQHDDSSVTSQIYDEVAREDPYEAADEDCDEDLYEAPDRIIEFPKSSYQRQNSGGQDPYAMAEHLPRPCSSSSQISRSSNAASLHGAAQETTPNKPFQAKNQQGASTSDEDLYETTDRMLPAVDKRSRPDQRRKKSGDSLYETAEMRPHIRNLETAEIRPHIRDLSPQHISHADNSNSADLYETTDLSPFQARPRSKPMHVTAEEDANLYDHLSSTDRDLSQSISQARNSKCADLYETTDLSLFQARPRSKPMYVTADENESIYHHLSATDQGIMPPRYDVLDHDRKGQGLPEEVIYESYPASNEELRTNRNDLSDHCYGEGENKANDNIVPAKDDVCNSGTLVVGFPSDVSGPHETSDSYDDIIPVCLGQEPLKSVETDSMPHDSKGAFTGDSKSRDSDTREVLTTYSKSGDSDTREGSPNNSKSRDTGEESRDSISPHFRARNRKIEARHRGKDKSEKLTVAQPKSFKNGVSPARSQQMSHLNAISSRAKSEVIRGRGCGRGRGRIVKPRAHTSQAISEERLNIDAEISRAHTSQATNELRLNINAGVSLFKRSPSRLITPGASASNSQAFLNTVTESELEKCPLYKSIQNKINHTGN